MSKRVPRSPNASPARGGPMPRRATILLLIVAAGWLLAACSSSAVAPGDPAGTKSATGSHLVGIVVSSDASGQPVAPISADDYTAAQTTEPFASKLADLVDENRLGINFVWLLVTGFLVMFMQAGFALVETGFTRAKNAMHTMSMNFMVYAIGIVGFFLVGFAFAFGGLPYVGGRQPRDDRCDGLRSIGFDIGGHALGAAGHDRLRALRRRL